MISSSKVWKYYLKIPPYQAQCNICSKILKTGGGTTNVRNHLKTQHKEYLEENIEAIVIEQKPKIEDTVVDTNEIIQEVYELAPAANFCTTDIRESVSPPVVPVRSRDRSRRRRRVVSKTVTFRSNNANGSRRDTSITKALTYMIYKDNRPISIVEEEGFKHLAETVTPLYKMPSKNRLTEMITAQYEEMKTKMKKKLKDVQHLSLSFHICTIRIRTFLIVAAHFINIAKKKPETIFLGIRPLRETLTIEHLSAEIQRVLGMFDVTESKIVSVCTDGTSNIMAAVRLLFGEEKHVQCLAHVLNSVVTDGLDDSTNPALRDLVDEIEIIVANAANSDIFTSSQKELFVESLTKRCFNTTDKLLLSLPYVVQALANRGVENSDIDPQPVTEIHKILAPFEAAIAEISANEQLTGNLVLPVINCIKVVLQNIIPAHEVAKTLRKKLLASLGTRTKSHLTNPLLCQAVLCDPRFQKLYLSPAAADKAVVTCCNEVKLHLRELRRSRLPDYTAWTSKGNPLWWKHDKNMAKGNFNKHVEVDTSIISESELKLYLRQQLLPRSADPLKFWLWSKGCMPSLSYVALKNLTVLGSLIPSEVFVPTLDSLLSFKKSRLTDDELVERVFLTRISKVAS